MDDADYHIGLAHGAIKGLSPDQKQEYFLMTEPVLKAIPVDAWLIGHMHVPYPADLEESKETSGYRIFNAGTPEQTDIANNTKGYCFVLTLNKTASKSTVSAHKYQSGDIVYLNPAIVMDPDGPALEDKLRQIADSISTRSVLRFKVAGTACPEDYKQKDALYLKVFDSLYKQGRLLTYKWDDSELCEQITKDKIRREFPEFGFAAKLLEQLEDPKEIQLAYDLVKAHQKWGGRKADDYQKR